MSELKSLRAKFNFGSLYRFSCDEPKGRVVWSSDGKRKYPTRLLNSSYVIVLNIEESKTVDRCFRVHLFAGDMVGFVVLKYYEVTTCLEYVATESAEP